MPDVVVPILLERTAAAEPDRTALILGEERLTYAELQDQVHRIAGLLRSQGLGRHRRRQHRRVADAARIPRLQRTINCPSQHSRQLGVVAEFGMSIQRQVVGEEGDVMIEQLLDRTKTQCSA